MQYIKRFESIDLGDFGDESIEYCKDIIETISEFDEELVAFDYEQGYHNVKFNTFSEEIKSENSKLCLRAWFKLKDVDATSKIDSKDAIDKHVLLMKKTKYILNQFSPYCKPTIEQ